MDRPPFRFAVQATNAAGGREWHDTVRQVEDLGYSTLFLADHYLGPGPAQREARTPRQDLAPIAAMAAAAAGDRDPAHRLPGLLRRLPRARGAWPRKRRHSICSPTGVSRFGIGAGWSGVEYAAMGLEFDRPGRRIAKLAEVVALIKAHWRGEELDCSGDFVRVHGYARAAASGATTPSADHHRRGRTARPLARRTRGRHRQHLQRAVCGAVTPTASTRRRSRSAGSASCVTPPVIASAVWTSKARRTSPRSPSDPETALDEAGGFDRASPPTCCATIPMCWSARRKTLSRRCIRAAKTLGVNYVTVQQSQIESFAPVVARLHGR